MCMLSKVNLKKENISADLVIWIITLTKMIISYC